MEQKKIRLSKSQVAAICAAFRTCFNDGDSLWVFGSRADITKRGGDIDLYVETMLGINEVLQAKLNFAKELFLRFDDRKIDIVIKHKNAEYLPIYKHAKETGIQII